MSTSETSKRSGEAQNVCGAQCEVWWFEVRCHLVLVVADVLYFIESKINTAVHQEIFMLPSADKLHGDADFPFQRDLAHPHRAKSTTQWFSDHLIIVLKWPGDVLDLNHTKSPYGTVRKNKRHNWPKDTDAINSQPQLCQTFVDDYQKCCRATWSH